MNPNILDKSSFLLNAANAIINSAYRKGGEPKGASLSLTPMQPTRTTSPEITPAQDKSYDEQRRIDRLSQEDKALFNKFAVNYLEDKDDIVNRMTRAVVDHYRGIFPDLYNVYSRLFRKNSTARNINNAPPQSVAAPQAVPNPSTGIPITKEDVKYIITELAVKPFGGDAVVGWDLDDISKTILEASNQYKVDPRLALAQGIQEGHFGVNPAAKRSRNTRNLYNVGNVDSGSNKYFSSYSDGIREYAELMNREYNWGGEGSWVTPEMMIDNDFYRSSGQGRYASASNYTNAIQEIVRRIDKKLAERNQGRRMVLVPNDNNNTGRIE